MQSIDPHSTDPDAVANPDQIGDSPDEPRFPVIVLAAPGFVLALFTLMADALAASLQSIPLAFAVALIAATGAIACFGVIAAKSPERHIQIGAGLAIGATVFALAVAILRLT